MDASIQEASKLPPCLELCDSKFTDIPALSSIFSKSFHPVSSFMKQAIPDTLQISQWWSEVNTLTLNDPEFRIMKIVDTAADRRIVAYTRWRLPAGVRFMAVDAGGWSAIPLTAYHDEALCNAFINFMAEQRRTLMQDRPHYFLEVLATIHDYKGQGAGKMLVQWGCDQADKAGVEVFVMTNRNTVPFYQKFGFELKVEAEMPGGLGYTEYVLVRPAKK